MAAGGRKGLVILAVVLFGSIAGAQTAIHDSIRYANAPKEIEVSPKRQWDLQGVHFSDRFAGARLNGLELINVNEFLVTVGPENTPINGSPWYAFKVWADTATTIKVNLNYTEFYHRYHPKVSKDGMNWQRLEEDGMEFPSIGHKHPGQTGDTILLYPTVSFDLDIGPDTLWVAAQEVITSHNEQRWWDQTLWGIDMDVVFFPARDSCPLFHVLNPGGDNVLMLIARQHPPEVTGAKALRHFFLRVMAEDSLALAFQEKWTVAVIPMMNPEGVDLGNWRHNAGGIDLNRDWLLAQHPETQCAQRILQKHIESSERTMLIDFHSTWKDIFYMQQPSAHNTFVPEWLDLYDEVNGETTPRKFVPVITPVTSLHWADALNVPAIVYEVGDDTPSELLRLKSDQAAESLMITLLNAQH